VQSTCRDALVCSTKKRLVPHAGRLTRHVRSFLRATLLAVLSVSALLVCPAPLGAAPQQPGSEIPVSLERIREELDKAPSRPLKPDVPVHLTVPTFRSRVDQRVFVPSLEEHLRKEFALTLLQRQSADWASRCCGYDLGQLVKGVNKVLRDRKVRKTREQIAQELAELEAARKTPAADVK
jgi:hypothetical protein